jgi:threonine/homoserine/homoserine lactone efflux protein
VHSQLLPFIGTAILIALTPGADTAVVVRNALVAGAPSARRTALGTSAGLLVWGAASACGVAAVLNASAEIFTAVKLAGAVYLAWLGLKAIRHAGAHEAAGRTRGGSSFRQGLLCNLLNPKAGIFRGGSSFRQGLLCNLLNPKAGIFFTALLPQFVSPDDPALLVSLLMTAIAATTALAWLSVYATVVPRAGDVLRRAPVRRALDRATGVVLIGLGVRLALTRR